MMEKDFLNFGDPEVYDLEAFLHYTPQEIRNYLIRDIDYECERSGDCNFELAIAEGFNRDYDTTDMEFSKEEKTSILNTLKEIKELYKKNQILPSYGSGLDKELSLEEDNDYEDLTDTIIYTITKNYQKDWISNYLDRQGISFDVISQAQQQKLSEYSYIFDDDNISFNTEVELSNEEYDEGFDESLKRKSSWKYNNLLHSYN